MAWHIFDNRKERTARGKVLGASVLHTAPGLDWKPMLVRDSVMEATGGPIY